MAKTDLTNQRQVFIEDYVRSGDYLETTKKVGKFFKFEVDKLTWSQ